jgi:hypothetical protein
VAAAAALVHAGAFAGTFQLDDWNVIVGDPRVQSLGAWWRSMPGIRPVLKLSYAANHASGLGLAGFHAFNVGVHALNAALVFALLSALARRCAPGERSPALAPAVAALLFALHPVQTEVVTYVSGRSASLAAAFVLGSALLHVAGRDGPRPWLATLASPVLFLLALGTREQSVALPFALLAVEAADVRRGRSVRDALRATAGHWLALAAAGAAFVASPVYRGMADASLRLRGAWTNLVTHLDGLAWLAGQVVRPDRLDADPLIPVRTTLDGPALLAGLALLAALAGGLALVRRRPAIGLPLLWTVLWLPWSGLWLPRPEPANDRQLYLALVGPAWLAGSALVAAGRARPWSGALAVALLGLLAALTVARSRVYADELAFWSAVIATSPGNARAQNNLGFALAARCRTAEAEQAFRRSMALDPGGFRAAMNLSLLRAGEPLEPGGPRCAAPPPVGR